VICTDLGYPILDSNLIASRELKFGAIEYIWVADDRVANLFKSAAMSKLPGFEAVAGVATEFANNAVRRM
jgi:hypothetical protein